MSKDKKLQIRNSTAEFLIFTRQAGEDGIEVRVAEEWATGGLWDYAIRSYPEIPDNLACSIMEAAHD